MKLPYPIIFVILWIGGFFLSYSLMYKNRGKLGLIGILLLLLSAYLTYTNDGILIPNDIKNIQIGLTIICVIVYIILIAIRHFKESSSNQLNKIIK